jgi:hypothetical protein
MNTTSNSTHASTGGNDRDGRQDTAARHAETGTGAWEDAVRLQRWASPDHADFYALAGAIVATLQALDDLAQVLHRQVTGYGRGRRPYDDTHQIEPAARLADAAAELAGLVGHLQGVRAPANRFWSAIGHIGVEPPDVEPPDSLDTGCPDITSSDRPSAGGEVSS